MKHILVLVLLLSQNIFSQAHFTARYAVYATSGTLEKFEGIESGNAEDKVFYASILNGADETLKVLTYELKNTKETSVFEMLPNKDISFKLNNYALIAATKDKFYTSNDTLYKKVVFNKEPLIITSTLNYNWTLTKETKKIDQYTCYKATCEKQWKGLASANGNKTTYTTTAWYCPKINSKLGPKGFGGLPGLILELQDQKTTFIIKSISFEPLDKISFEEIRTIKHLSEEEFYQKVADLKQMMFGGKK